MESAVSLVMPLWTSRVALVAIAIVLLIPPAAWSHGPTISLTPSSVRPSQITIPAGTTVHFRNASAGQQELKIVAVDGSFESPPITRSDGWHRDFDVEGTVRFHLVDSSSVSGVIIVGPPSKSP